MSAGDLTEGEIEGMKNGTIPDPTVVQVAALAAVFGVAPSYLVDRGKVTPVLDEETLDALADETANAILTESARLPEREKRVVLGIAREFAGRPEYPLAKPHSEAAADAREHGGGRGGVEFSVAQPSAKRDRRDFVLTTCE